MFASNTWAIIKKHHTSIEKTENRNSCLNMTQAYHSVHQRQTDTIEYYSFLEGNKMKGEKQLEWQSR